MKGRLSWGPLYFECRLLTDTVEKVENRATLKIPQMLIFGQLRRGDAL